MPIRLYQQHKQEAYCQYLELERLARHAGDQRQSDHEREQHKDYPNPYDGQVGYSDVREKGEDQQSSEDGIGQFKESIVSLGEAGVGVEIGAKGA